MLANAPQAPQGQKVTLGFFQDSFVVRDGIFVEYAPIKLPKQQPRLNVVFRKGSTFVVWDERGLTVRVGEQIKTTRLPDISTSPKVFTKDEIGKTLTAIRKKKRSRDAAALSGYKRVGNYVYLVPRWVESDGTAWLEALVRVDLSEKFPVPKLVGRIRALSLADKPIDDKLFVLDDKLTLVGRESNRWGVAQIDPKDARIDFKELGAELQSFATIQGHVGAFIEKTAYGTTVAGRVDLHTGFRKPLAEAKAKMRFIDAVEPLCLVISTGASAVLHNTVTGQQLSLPSSSSARRTSRGIVIWTPLLAPTKAWLYDPKAWTPVTWWSAVAPVDRP